MTPTLVMTRAADVSDVFAAQVRAAFGQSLTVINSPALTIEMVGGVTLPPADHLIFTSVNGVNWARAHGLRAAHIWCVGDRTAEAARGLGHVHNAQGNAMDLANLILQHPPSAPMLHLVGDHQHGDLAAILQASGIPCEAHVVYRQIVNPPAPALIRALGQTAPLVAPVFSARSALIFGGVARQALLHGVAISDRVGETLVDLGFDTIRTADRPDAAGMCDATVNLLKDLAEARI